ncbi:MAG TPA: energy transducer TonB, partial [Allosphingosinicella sp.]
KPIPPKVRTKAPEGAAAPPNLRSVATPIVAPPTEIRFVIPPPIVAAPVAGIGGDPSAGAADVPGPGTGSGGVGNGTGSGGQGNGGGGGGGSHARWVKGGIDPSDYPRRALEAHASGTVFLRFTVGTDGHVRGCAVTRSSGNAELDSTTCRLIERRFRYKPARDARGKAVAETIVGEHVWSFRDLEPLPPEEEPDGPDADPPRGA